MKIKKYLKSGTYSFTVITYTNHMCWKISDEHVHHPHLKEVGVVAAAVAHQSDNMRVLPGMGS